MTEAGIAAIVVRVRFERAAFHGFPGSNYDFVAVFEALHDSGDPVRNATAH